LLVSCYGEGGESELVEGFVAAVEQREAAFGGVAVAIRAIECCQEIVDAASRCSSAATGRVVSQSWLRDL
jgi:hypothetical protein